MTYLKSRLKFASAIIEIFHWSIVSDRCFEHSPRVSSRSGSVRDWRLAPVLWPKNPYQLHLSYAFQWITYGVIYLINSLCSICQCIGYSPFDCFIFIFTFSYRHSLNSISETLTSELQGCAIWLTHYELIQWSLFSLHFSHIHLQFFTQTFITLDLAWNAIGARGVQHLADALRSNTVILILSSLVSYTTSFFHIDTQDTKSYRQCHRRCRCTISSWCITN